MPSENELRSTALEELIAGALPGARIVSVTELGADASVSSATTKGVGYGVPLKIELEHEGRRRIVVLHTATSNRFGHDRRSDRAQEALLAADTYASIPRHVHALDVGALRDDSHVSLGNTREFYLLTEWGEGEPYANDLRRIAESGQLGSRDLLRAELLASYLVELHRSPISRPFARERALRDLLGSGEGIFGIVDGYPVEAPGISRDRLREIEKLCWEWRWRLKEVRRPLVQIHGDFHPFNVLFDAQGQLVLLDTSRGSVGEAADDVTCMALNYVFFALDAPGARDALLKLWFGFWNRYLESSLDSGMLAVLAPFLAWRGLVLANPVWYPKLSETSRAKLLGFVEATLKAERFEPELATSFV